MTVFDDILNAEKEALSSIESAKTETADLITATKNEQNTRLESEVNNLASAEATALEQHQVETKKKTDAITADVEKQVEKVTKKFIDQAESLKQEVKQSFSK